MPGREVLEYVTDAVNKFLDFVRCHDLDLEFFTVIGSENNTSIPPYGVRIRFSYILENNYIRSYEKGMAWTPIHALYDYSKNISGKLLVTEDDRPREYRVPNFDL